MTLLLDLTYLIGLLLAAPFLALKSLRTRKYRSGLKARLGIGDPILPRRPDHTRMLLLHCVSVGELLSVQTLVKRLLAADPALHIAISTGTDTGTARAAALYRPAPEQRVHPVRFPLDFSFAVESLFDRVHPDAIALVELETWPNFLMIARRRRIPVAIINGRISDKSFPRYRRIRPIIARMLRQITWIGAQTPTIAARFIALGADPKAVVILPTLKYDNAQLDDAVGGVGGLPGSTALAAAIGLSPDHQLFVAGSTGPGEEIPILDAYESLRHDHPRLRLAIVPRHPEVVPQVLAAINARHLTPIRRTEHPDLPTEPVASARAGTPASLETRNPKLETLTSTDIFLLDTMGELRKLYALAFAVFVGRSLVKLGGSDMIEVAALAKPCCFGPYTANFAEVVELLLNEKAAARIASAADLAALLRTWLQNPQAARDLGQQARRVVLAQRGSTDLYVERLLALLKRQPGRQTR